MDLTKRQQEIFDFIRKYSAKYGYPPTVRDIGLWGPRVRKAFEDLGVMQFADRDSAAMLAEDNRVAEEFDADSWDIIASRMSHIDGDATNPEIYRELIEALKKAETEHGTGGNVIFYLAVASSLFGTIVERLADGLGATA